MDLNTSQGWSFPSALGRIHLDPGAAEGTGLAASTAAPESSLDSAINTPVTVPSSPGSVRDFDTPVESGAGSVAPGAGGSGVDATRPTTPADPNQAAGWRSLREVAAQQYGIQFPSGVQDDDGALAYLAQQIAANRQSDVYAQIGRQIAPHTNEIQQYFAQKTQAQTQPKPRPAWEAPQFDDRWIGLVDQDPTTGLFVGKPGVPAQIVSQVNEYAEWKRNYDRNPGAVINQAVESRAKEIAQEQVRQEFARFHQQSAIDRIMETNSAWFYAKDANGGFTNQPSQLGASYLRCLTQVKQAGVSDPQAQDRLAKQILQGELALSNNAKFQQQQAAAAPPAQQSMNRPNTNPLGALTPQERANTPAAVEPDQTGLNLYERMRQQFAAGGVTDADIELSLG